MVQWQNAKKSDCNGKVPIKRSCNDNPMKLILTQWNFYRSETPRARQWKEENEFKDGAVKLLCDETACKTRWHKAVTLGLITWAAHLKSTTSEAIELNLRSHTQNKMDCQMHCKNWRLRKRMLEILRRLKAARQARVNHYLSLATNRLKPKMCWAAFHADLQRSECVSQCRGTAPLRLGFLTWKRVPPASQNSSATSRLSSKRQARSLKSRLCNKFCATSVFPPAPQRRSEIDEFLEGHDASYFRIFRYGSELWDNQLVSFVDALWRTKKPRPLGLAHCLRPSQNSWLSNGKYPSLGASLLRSGDQCKSALAPGKLREENEQRPHAKRVHQGGLVNSRTVVVNIVQVAPSAQGAFAADLVGAPQARVGPSEPKKNPDGGLDGSGGRCPQLDDEGSAARILARWAGPPMSTFAAARFGRGARYTGWIGWVNRMTSSPSDDETSRFTTSSSASPPIKPCSDSSDRVGDQ